MNTGAAAVRPTRATLLVYGEMTGLVPTVECRDKRNAPRLMLPRQVRVAYERNHHGYWHIATITLYGPLLTPRTGRPSARDSAQRVYSATDPEVPLYVRTFIAHFLPPGEPHAQP